VWTYSCKARAPLHTRASWPRRWETGYWCTMDIAHDRAGYYLCWGCLVWVPAVYTSPALFLVSHPVRWGAPAAAAIAAAGAASIYINYDSDRQRQARPRLPCMYPLIGFGLDAINNHLTRTARRAARALFVPFNRVWTGGLVAAALGAAGRNGAH